MNTINIKFSIIGLILALTIIPVAMGSSLTVTKTWVNGETLTAKDLNNNFTDAEKSVTDNDDRITAIEATVANLALTRTISIPAFALTFNAVGSPVTADGAGLRWAFNFSGGANLTTKAPADYAGGDVVFYIFFQTTTATSGVVDFFIRPTSYNSGDSTLDPGSVSCTSVEVAGASGFGTVYEQSCNIVASRLSEGWWTTSMQRQGSSATYVDDVIVRGVAFEYPAIQ